MASETTKPMLLSLPPEIHEFIAVEVLQPTGVNEFVPYGRFFQFHHKPREHLLRRLVSLSACKELRDLALQAYFRLTQLTVIIVKVEDWGDGVGRGGIDETEYGVFFGTFADDDFFTANTINLLIEIKDFQFSVDALVAVSGLLRKCPRLAKVTLRTGNLKVDQAEAFKIKVEATTTKLADERNRKIIVVDEDTKEYNVEMEFRRSVEKRRYEDSVKQLQAIQSRIHERNAARQRALEWVRANPK